MIDKRQAKSQRCHVHAVSSLACVEAYLQRRVLVVEKDLEFLRTVTIGSVLG
jgi:hypothetical protein